MRRAVLFGLMIVLGLIFSAACAAESPPAVLMSTPEEASADLSDQDPAPSPVEVLSICLGSEPDSLFIYQDQSRAADIIRQAVYDGPVDEISYQIQPVILSSLPSLENGLVNLEPVEVARGERMVDQQGEINYLVPGVHYFPAGCFSEDCLEIYQGQDPVLMDQTVIIYPLIDDLTWSDGESLTAQDSLFSYQIARELFSGDTAPKSLRYTESYLAGDETTIEWRGIPGFRGLIRYTDYFFTPLPEHIWRGVPLQQILASEQASRRPLGWGAYQIEEWVPGDHLTLSRNPYFFHADELAFDLLVFRFPPGADEGLAAVKSGECEILLAEPDLSQDEKIWKEIMDSEELTVIRNETKVWDQISFGILSKDGTETQLASAVTRRALGFCINRTAIADQDPRAGRVVNHFLPWGHPDNTLTTLEISYDPQQGSKLLDQAGWLDEDNDPTTPRTARDVPGVRDGSSLELQLLVTGEDQVPDPALKIAQDLAGCGVGVEVIGLSAGEMLAPGPEGPVFGRSFDLAKFAWRTGTYHPCLLFTSEEIPGSYPAYPRAWGGSNASGFSDPEYDAACQLLRTNLPDQPQVQSAQETVQNIYLDQLPGLPLYFREEIILVSENIQGLESGSYDPLWNIENIQ